MAITPFMSLRMSLIFQEKRSQIQLIPQYRFFFATSSWLVSDYQTKPFHILRGFFCFLFSQSTHICRPFWKVAFLVSRNTNSIKKMSDQSAVSNVQFPSFAQITFLDAFQNWNTVALDRDRAELREMTHRKEADRHQEWRAVSAGKYITFLIHSSSKLTYFQFCGCDKILWQKSIKGER